ncbi:hypothetical protein BH11BAC7_BH11BAC7_27860 [soil metagenome]
MKNLVLFSFILLTFFQLNAQVRTVSLGEKSQVWYKDTTVVEIVKHLGKENTYALRPEFKKGDWELFYDEALLIKMAECHFIGNECKTGHWKEWYTNGNPKSDYDYTSSWLDPFPVGMMYYPGGKMQLERVAQNDTLLETSYFESGSISCIRKFSRNGLLFSQAQFYENGKLMVEFNPTSLVPLPVKKYSSGGKLMAEYSWYIQGYSGNYTEYHEDGKTIAVAGHYQQYPKNSTEIRLQKKSGEWNYFDNKGKPVSTETWVNGKLVKKEYDVKLNE